MKIETRNQIIGLVLFTVVITVVTALTVHYPIWANIPLNIVLPLGIVLFAKINGFERIKLGTLVIGRVIIVVTVLGYMSGDFLVAIIFWLLRLNILEATIKDLKGKRYLNAISGILLIASTWSFYGKWEGVYYLTYPWAAVFWIIAYTIWNWNFVFLNFVRSIAIYHIGVLVAPMLYCLVMLEPGYWLIMRAGTLILAGCGQVSFEKKVINMLTNDGFERATFSLPDRKAQFIILFIVVACLTAFYVCLSLLCQ